MNGIEVRMSTLVPLTRPKRLADGTRDPEGGYEDVLYMLIEEPEPVILVHPERAQLFWATLRAGGVSL